MAFVNGLWPARRWMSRKGHEISPYKAHGRPTSKGTTLNLTTVEFVNGLRPSNTWPVRQRGLI